MPPDRFWLDQQAARERETVDVGRNTKHAPPPEGAGEAAAVRVERSIPPGRRGPGIWRRHAGEPGDDFRVTPQLCVAEAPGSVKSFTKPRRRCRARPVTRPGERRATAAMAYEVSLCRAGMSSCEAHCPCLSKGLVPLCKASLGLHNPGLQG